MNTYQSKFKSEGFATVFEVAGKAFVPVTVASGLQAILLALTIIPLVIFGMGIDFGALMELSQEVNPIQRQQMAEEFFSENMRNFSGAFIGAAIFASLFMILLYSWQMHFTFLAIGNVILDEKKPFAELLKASFSKSIFRFILAGILLSLVYTAGVFLLAGAGAVFGDGLGVLLVILGVVFLGMLLVRMMFVFPGIVHGNMRTMEAFSHSWALIPFGRSAKYFFFGILFFMALMVAMLALGMFQAALMMIPVIGMVIYYLASIAIGGFMAALFGAIQSGIYFRHSSQELEAGKMDIEDHLIN